MKEYFKNVWSWLKNEWKEASKKYDIVTDIKDNKNNKININLLLLNLPTISYKDKCMNDEITFISNNIVELINELNYINSVDLINDKLELRDISEETFINKTLSMWFSLDGYYLNNLDKTFKSFVTEYKILSDKYNELIKLKDVYATYNSRKLQPYIISIENILNYILEFYQRSH